jgi:hypothetical protein
MKKRSRVVSFFVALVIALSCAAVGMAQTQRPILGGYKPIAKDNEGVLAAAEHALSAQGEKEGLTFKLVSVEQAEYQVVAGTNYRLCLKVATEDEEGESGETQDVKVLVFRSLQNAFTLKSWEVAECSESD